MKGLVGKGKRSRKERRPGEWNIERRPASGRRPTQTVTSRARQLLFPRRAIRAASFVDPTGGFSSSRICAGSSSFCLHGRKRGRHMRSPLCALRAFDDRVFSSLYARPRVYKLCPFSHCLAIFISLGVLKEISVSKKKYRYSHSNKMHTTDFSDYWSIFIIIVLDDKFLQYQS